MPSSSQIAGQIAALDAAVVGWEIAKADLSLAAVAGDEDARNGLADVLGKLNGAKADRLILVAAHEAAVSGEAEAMAAAREAAAHTHMDNARRAATELAEAAERFDRLSAEVADVLAELGRAERQIWTSLAAAGQRPADVIRGRSGIADEAASHLAARLQGKRLERTLVGNVATTIQNAWSFLLKPKKKAA